MNRTGLKNSASNQKKKFKNLKSVRENVTPLNYEEFFHAIFEKFV